MKHKFLASALFLAPCFLLAGCTGIPTLSLSSNWYANTANDSNLTGTSETLIYDVSFTADKNSPFTANFTGSYTTNLKEEMIPSEPGTPLGYYYRTELSLTGSYTVNGKKSEEFTDSVVSEVWFLRTDAQLRPIRNVRKIRYHAPDLNAANTTSSVLYDYTYTAEYNTALTEAELSYTYELPADMEDTQRKVRIGGSGTYFDDAELLFALRATSLASKFSFRSVNPVTGEPRTVSVKPLRTDEEFKANFSVNGVQAEQTLKAADISVGYTGDRQGRAQHLTYAVCTNPYSNTYRNVLLSAEGFMQSALGTFRIDLKEATFNNK